MKIAIHQGYAFLIEFLNGCSLFLYLYDMYNHNVINNESNSADANAIIENCISSSYSFQKLSSNVAH